MNLAPFAAITFGLIVLSQAAAPEWVYLENEKVKVGVRKDAGSCIGYFSAKDGPNVLNSFDHGRFVQQSYYGKPDDSLWGKQPWRYNPVQGGDYKGNAATVLEFRAEKNRLYSKTQPKHWATGADIPEMAMEQWISLEDSALHLRIRMSYTGSVEHPPHHQEIPAVFVQSEYRTLVLNDGKSRRRWEPGWPNEYAQLPEHWAMFLNQEGRGVGVFVPKAKEATCYRFGKPGEPSACSYIAPITTFALKPGMTFEYEAWLALGTEEEILKQFETLKAVEK